MQLQPYPLSEGILPLFQKWGSVRVEVQVHGLQERGAEDK